MTRTGYIVQGAGYGLMLAVLIAVVFPLRDGRFWVDVSWWFVAAVLAVGGAFMALAVRERNLERREDVATLERAESVLAQLNGSALDDAPPSLPLAIPVEMRDPAFRARIEQLKQADGEVQRRRLPTGGTVKYRVGRDVLRIQALKDQSLVAERRFTALTHCPHGHVATHWLGATTDDHVERICRFERCGATWLEKQ